MAEASRLPPVLQRVSRPVVRFVREGGTARDVLVALAIVAVILGVLFAYARVWPPLVVVESASMMHPQDDRSYGNLGTIDPGDMVVVKRVTSREQVSLLFDGDGGRYGADGDVIVYYPRGNREVTPVIHRAVAWVEVRETLDGPEYRVEWRGGERVFGAEGVFLPEVGIREPRYSAEDGYKPPHSGFLTKGDNPVTNPVVDQATTPPISPPVRVEWLEGEARGELPWFGLIKLAFSNTFNVNSPPTDWVRFGNAYAPADLWVMLATSLVAIIVVPLSIDVVQAWRKAEEEGVAPDLPVALKRVGSRMAGGSGGSSGGGSSGSAGEKRGASERPGAGSSGRPGAGARGRSSRGRSGAPRGGGEGSSEPSQPATFKVVRKKPADEDA